MSASLTILDDFKPFYKGLFLNIFRNFNLVVLHVSESFTTWGNEQFLGRERLV